MTKLDALADRVSRGDMLEAADADVIVHSPDLIAIGMMADDARRQRHGKTTTFLRVFEMHVEAVPAAPPAQVNAGEFRIVGQPRTLDAACTAVTAARRLAGSGYLTGFSLGDVLALSEPDALLLLRESGLEGIAEAPVDSVAVTSEALAAARSAGLVVDRLTVRDVQADAVALLTRAVELSRAAGGFRTFAPLPRNLSVTTPTTGYDDVKLVALARLLGRHIPSIQVDWRLYGPKLAQVALTMGADDVDGVAAVESGTLGPRRSALEEIRNNIRAAGLEPVERDGRHARVAE